MKGYVKAFALDANSIDSGTVAVLKGDGYLELCTVVHMDATGLWYVHAETFSGLTPPGTYLCKLIVMTEDRSYPLKLNQWKKSLKAGEVDNSNKQITFTVVEPKFYKGGYLNECLGCTAHFQGAKKQAICPECNKENSVAKIVIGKKEVKPAKDTKKRPRMIAGSRCKDIARQAFQLGKTGQSEEFFETWYNNQM